MNGSSSDGLYAAGSTITDANAVIVALTVFNSAPLWRSPAYREDEESRQQHSRERDR